jgi:hypothetical protein
MTILTNIGSLNVVLALAGRVNAIVTTDAIASDIHMVKVCWQPACRRVAVLAIIAAGNVRQCLAGRNPTIMA